MLFLTSTIGSEEVVVVAVVGDSGAGDAVELRDVFLRGEASGAGNSRGWWRVETIFIQRL
jgi:hypothetical protein